MSANIPKSAYMAGQFLIAMPNMNDARFSRAVVFICAHSADGAMGLIINRLYENLSFTGLLGQLEIAVGDTTRPVAVHFGGPVESGRGFVLHSNDYSGEGTMPVSDQVSLTATIDVLKSLAAGQGPQHCLLALGYTGWSAGQLDAEVQANGWLHAPADTGLLFDAELETKWDRVLAQVGINPAMLSSEAGHA